MKNLNKKGFFMTETLMVIVFVTIIFTFLYVSVIPLIGNYNDKVVRQSDIDIVYKLYSIRKMINMDSNKENIMEGEYKTITCEDFTNTNKDYCNRLMNILELTDYRLIYTDNISSLYEIIDDKEIKDYLKDYKDDNENAIILLDKNKHTITHLNYIDSDMKLGDLLIYKSKKIAKRNKDVCNPLFTDIDGINYFSGTNDCVNFNYVWYSGKLWRITAIYPDGAIKMVTENNITSIAFDESSGNFYTDSNTTSYIYQWLNEDFYETLYNASELIDTTKRWNATKPSNTIMGTRPSEITMVNANVGLLNSYEYYNSYRCIDSDTCTGSSYSTGYANIGYKWWLLNKYSSSSVNVPGIGNINTVRNFCVLDTGNADSNVLTSSIGVRPSIILKSVNNYTGNGTIVNPYRLVGDKSTGRINDLINTRLSGEYVKLKNGSNEMLFRIVSIDGDKTKIVTVDLADNRASRKFATNNSDTLWGSGTTTSSNTWYTYLNSIYYPNLVNTYGNIFDKSIYYLGVVTNNYKSGVCENATNVSINDCQKTSRKGEYYIGLLRAGEMFSTQQGEKSVGIWLINSFADNYVWVINPYGANVQSNGNASYTHAARPTLHLKSNVRIKSGKGTQDDPYVVGL